MRKALIDCLKQEKAKGAFVIRDLRTGETCSYKEKEVVPSASLIKMFVMIRAFEQIKCGRVDLQTEIHVTPEDLVPFSVLTFLRPRAYQMKELIDLMIVYSDNTATNVLIDFLGMDRINDTIRALGYKASVLQRKMMDFEAAEKGKQNYTSAEEMSDLLQKMYENRLLGSFCDEKMLEIMKGQSDETMMRQSLPDELTIARKSGELERLDHDMAIVYTQKGDYIYVFFCWEAEDNNQAREILAKTSKIVFDAFLKKN